LSLRSLS